ncbi:MAG: DUF4340 domain-containing protein [Spirochaetes bacterium]|nr:DUF4340 domain-containing protein [Spirochaetota bacterium]
MKNSRTIITISVIVLLSIAVILKNRGCGTGVPGLKTWSKPADEIEINGRDIALKFIKKDNRWYINEQEYPGDRDLIENFEQKVRDLKLLDLVSEKDFYDKYDLTDENGVTVVVKDGEKLLRKLVIGKSGSTNNHSFVRIDDKKEIYLASGITKSDFTRSVSDLRDKRIFDIKSSDIKSFGISYGGKNFVFHRRGGILPPADSGKGDTLPPDNPVNGNNPPPDDSPKWICKGYENITLKDSSIDSILNIFSPLKAAEFPEKILKENLRDKLCVVNIESDDRKIELLIYDKKDQGMNLATSPESKYVFTLGDWQINKLFIKDLNGLSIKK